MQSRGKPVATANDEPGRADQSEDAPPSRRAPRTLGDDGDTPPDTRRTRRWGLLRRRDGVVTLRDGRRIIRL